MGIGNVFDTNLIDELAPLRELYPSLRQEVSDGLIILSGKISFCLLDSSTGKPPITDRYSVEITISANFPRTIPTVKEIDGKIGRSYEHISQNGFLCLGIPSELNLILKKYATIGGFIENILKPNLFAYSFYIRYGFMPWGEHPAGRNGIYLRYAELFHTLDVDTIVALLSILVEGNYRGNLQCPCERKKTLNECHGKAIYSLWQLPWNYIVSDYYALLDFKYDIDTEILIYRKYGII